MPPPAGSAPSGLGIAAVERDTGLSKDTLRVWERRYGFPQPYRDPCGERLYPAEQVERLGLMKRLMDLGLRPGRLSQASIDELRQQLGSNNEKLGAGGTAHDWLIDRLRSGDAELLRQEMAQRLAREGLQRFVCETVPAMNREIGEAWESGRVRIYEEHLYTELLQNQLRAAIHSLPRAVSRPQVLLTTLKDEEHLLGLLMAEALLAAEGAWCLSLGAQTPVADIAGAAAGTTADVIALSFSSAYPWRKARDALLELRASLPDRVEIWVGGGTLNRHKKHLPGIRCFAHIAEIPLAVGEWRSARKAGAAPSGA